MYEGKNAFYLRQQIQAVDSVSFKNTIFLFVF